MNKKDVEDIKLLLVMNFFLLCAIFGILLGSTIARIFI